MFLIKKEQFVLFSGFFFFLSRILLYLSVYRRRLLVYYGLSCVSVSVY